MSKPEAKPSVVIIHYHLKPGGVTRVIERVVESLADQVDLLILTGEELNQPSILTPYTHLFSALNYDQIPLTNPEQTANELYSKAYTMLGRAPDIWHIHNHSLGKNSFTPLFVKHLAERGARLLLQPHDFAEDGRPKNFKLLRNHLEQALDTTLYPSADHILYAPINFRDKSILELSGLQQVHELPNAVTALPISSQAPCQSKKTIVYPARAIRRKNLGEFLLWSLIAPDDYHFISTLAPKNPLAQPIYDDWVNFAKELNLNIEFNVGEKQNFTNLIHNASALMTTSIAEGFGLAFLEPWLANRPLIGRNIPEITTDFTSNGLDLSALYDQLLIPINWIGKDFFIAALTSAMQASYTAYDYPWKESYVEQAIDRLVQNEYIDFGRLSETLQRNVIQHLCDHPEDRKKLPPFSLNTTQQTLDKNRVITEEKYSLEAYGKRLISLYKKLMDAPISSVSYISPAHLLNQFLRPERFNLLRT